MKDNIIHKAEKLPACSIAGFTDLAWQYNSIIAIKLFVKCAAQ